jgi:hypothetical protein
VILNGDPTSGCGTPNGEGELILPELDGISMPGLELLICSDMWYDIALRQIKEANIEADLVTNEDVLILEKGCDCRSFTLCVLIHRPEAIACHWVELQVLWDRHCEY